MTPRRLDPRQGHRAHHRRHRGHLLLPGRQLHRGLRLVHVVAAGSRGLLRHRVPRVRGCEVVPEPLPHRSIAVVLHTQGTP